MIYVLLQIDVLPILQYHIRQNKEQELIDVPSEFDFEAYTLQVLKQVFLATQKRQKLHDQIHEAWVDMLNADRVIQKIRQIGMAQLLSVDEDGNTLLRIK